MRILILYIFKYYETYNIIFNKGKLLKKVYWTEMVKIIMNVMKKLYN